jgi:magnesium-transporting ATPase (P-type)
MASVNKTSRAAAADIQAKASMVFADTTVVNGSAVYLVVRTSMVTEISKIHQAAQEHD